MQVPGWRPDVAREEDLIEEIARLRGYDSFPTEMRPLRPSSVPDDPAPAMERRLRRVLTGLGLHESRSNSLGPKQGETAQAVLNPLSADEGFLRTDLASGLVRAVEYNWSVRERNVRLFEIGTVFDAASDGGRPLERRLAGGVISGASRPAHWTESGKSVDFDRWDVKSLFEEVVLTAGAVGNIEESEGRWVLRDPDGGVCGWAGEIGADRPSWAGCLFGFELTLPVGDRPLTQFVPRPATPSAARDLALVLPDGVSAAQVDEVIARRGGKLLESATIFDEFRGKDVAGRSVAWRLVFRAPERTLRDEEIDAVLTNILKGLEKQLGVERRET